MCRNTDCRYLLLTLLGLGLCGLGSLKAQVVINEIGYDPASPSDRIEFLELYNAGATPVDLSGWYFDKGISFTFPTNTFLNAGAYLLIAEDPGSLSGFYALPGGVLGPFTGSLANEGEALRLRQANGQVVAGLRYENGKGWPSSDDLGRSIQLQNPALNPAAAGAWRAAPPTPGAQNTGVWVANASSLTVWSAVSHSPETPGSNQDVEVRLELTQSVPGLIVTLEFQVVEPGQYISLSDAAYQTNWVSVPMEDKGQGIWERTLPGYLQQHRQLIRYRIRLTGVPGGPIQLPYADDRQPNFAYFVYDGLPDFGPYPLPQLQQVPVYHLLAKSSEVNAYILAGTSSDYLSTGTLVYAGQVYDHVGYRAQGRQQRHERTKRNIKINFNAGYPLISHDDFGQARASKDKLVLHGGTLAGPEGAVKGRQDGGLSEGVAFRQFDLFGAAGSPADWMQLRIIDGIDENPANANDGDFWGLYNILSEYDDAFLQDEGLPDGPIHAYKPEELKNIPQAGPFTFYHADYNDYASNATTGSLAWYQAHLDLDAQYRFMACNEAISQQELAYFTKHYQFDYQNPLTGKWFLLPSDFDETMALIHTPSQDILKNGILTHPTLAIEYQGYLREFRDLLFNPEQFGQLIDEKAQSVHTTGEALSLAHADRDRWALEYTNLGGEIDDLKTFFTARQIYIDNNWLNDANIPQKPVVSYIGGAAYPADDLLFSTSTFSDPQGNGTFGAMEWRLAEVSDPNNPFYQATDPRIYEITPVWESGVLSSFNSTQSLPEGYVKPAHSYRVRVRMQDNTGRWSHWSDPVHFIAGPPLANPDSLVINEIHYHPLPALGQEESALEFVELKNTSLSPVSLQRWSVEGGIRYLFPDATVLPPDSFYVLANDETEFFQVYGFAPDGVFSGKLGNAGDSLILRDAYGQLADSVVYTDRNPWPSQADGKGPSMELLHTDFDNALGKFWFASPGPLGSPGADNAYYCDNVPGSIVINELNYRFSLPFDGLNGENWVELYNPGSGTIDLSGWQLVSEDSLYTLSGPTVLAPGDYLVLAENTAAFALAFPGVTDFVGPMGFGLDNQGERLALISDQHCLVDFFRYNDKSPWPATAAGKGPTLMLSDPALDNTEAASWIASGNYSGTPGAPNTVLCTSPVPAIIINEINYNSNSAVNPGDWIELYNPNPYPVDVSAWELHDADRFFVIPPGTQISADGYLVLAKSVSSFQSVFPGLPNLVGGWSFSLNGDGERIGLFTQNRCPVTEQKYNDSAPWPTQPDGNGPTLSLIDPSRDPSLPGSWVPSSQGNAPLGTPGAPNNIPNVCTNWGSTAVVINEVVYNSPLGMDAGNWLELYNAGSQTVDLSGWQLHESDTAFVIPNGTLLAPDAYLILAEDLALFASYYPSVTAIGSLGFGFSNNGERLMLYSPERCVMDSVRYNDKAPWPTAPDGQGPSLSLISPVLDNALAASWTDSEGAGTPGADNDTHPCDLLSDAHIVLNEINYQSPLDTDAGDWVELYNAGSVAVDLSGWLLMDANNYYLLPPGTTLGADQYLVLVSDSQLFQSIHPTVTNFVGNLDFGLSNRGERLLLYSRLYCLVDSLTYDEASPWPKDANGRGPSLALIDAEEDNAMGANWIASAGNGTPGQANEWNTAPGVVLPDLGVWLMADAGLTLSAGDVSLWSDQSGNGIDASLPYAGKRPVVAPDSLNHHALLRFDGVNDWLKLNGATNFLLGESSIFAVIIPRQDTDDGYWLSTHNGGSNRIKFGHRLTGELIYDDDAPNMSSDIYFQKPTLVSLVQPAYSQISGYVNGNMGSPWINPVSTPADRTSIGQEYDASGYDFQTSNHWKGDLAELIIYDTPLDQASRHQVETYLNLKYAITIPVSSHDYYTHTSHPYAIAGIGRDARQKLLQKASKSVSDSTVLEVSHATDLGEGNFLVWGHDGATAKFGANSSNVPSGFIDRLPRTWRVAKTGKLGGVRLEFDLSTLNWPVQDPRAWVLLIDDDGDFANGGTEQVAADGLIGEKVYFSSVHLVDGRYLALAREKHSLLEASLWLQGAYVSSSGLMRDDLRDQGLVPLTDPYLGTDQVEGSLLAATGNDAVVDWVKLELRDPVDSLTVRFEKAFLLQRDGNLMGTDGQGLLYLPGVETGQYFVVIRHRNHLGLMSATPLSLGGTPPHWDLRSNAAPLYGQNVQKSLGGGAFGLWAGDANGDGKLVYQGIANDPATPFLKVLVDPGNTTYARNYIVTGYDRADTNMDGKVIFQGGNADTTPIFLNILSHPSNSGFNRNFLVKQQLP